MGNSGVSQAVNSLVYFDGQLHAAGAFINSGSTVVNRVVRWDGSGWTSVGGGVNAAVQAMTVFQNDLYVFGDMTTAGSLPVEHWARYRHVVRPCVPDADCSGTLNVADIFFFLNRWFSGSSDADFNGGGLDVGDVFTFLNSWFSGC